MERTSQPPLNHHHRDRKRIAVVGAGIGGLATAMRLAAAGAEVTVLERGPDVGGKMRALPTDAGPVDAGPTVLTMRPVFEDLFMACGEALSDHVTLKQSDTLARHFWSDGTVLDLTFDPGQSTDNIKAVFGPKAARQFVEFSKRAQLLFDAFDAPMMRAPQPSSLNLAKVVLKNPRLIGAMAPHKTLAAMLRDSFDEPRLRQLFGRYATYVGGSPFQAPALLSLIWHAEASGVWAVEGGMHALAQAIKRMITQRGGTFQFDTDVTDISPQDDGIVIRTKSSELHFDAVVFNGDPRALSQGLLGRKACAALPADAVEPRSLSANVMAFAATPRGAPLVHHNVFFGDNPKDEFDPIHRSDQAIDPTLYVCAQDRGGGSIPPQLERFEIIMNAPPCKDTDIPNPKDAAVCLKHILNRLSDMGLTFDPAPTTASLTQAPDFHRLFPASQGSLYGRSPHGMTAGLKRPTARTKIPGLYLAGGGAHPGAGVPMATLSGKHAAEAICTDLGLTSTCHQTDTHGGTSTAFPTMDPAPSLSSRS